MLIDYIKNLPPDLAVVIMSMLPVIEIRGSIPFGIGVYHMNPLWVLFIACLADVIPAILIVYFVEPLSLFLSRHSKIAKKFFDWWFYKVMLNFEQKYLKYGKIALFVFVAIPLPLTGAWTGAVASFLFKIPKRDAIWLIGSGVLVAGIIVLLASLGIFSFFT